MHGSALTVISIEDGSPLFGVIHLLARHKYTRCDEHVLSYIVFAEQNNLVIDDIISVSRMIC